MKCGSLGSMVKFVAVDLPAVSASVDNGDVSAKGCQTMDLPSTTMCNGDGRKIDGKSTTKIGSYNNALVKRFIGSKSDWKAIHKTEWKRATRGAVRYSVQVTCSCPRWEDITVNCFDSYGDGWSIGYLQILEDEAQTSLSRDGPGEAQWNKQWL